MLLKIVPVLSVSFVAASLAFAAPAHAQKQVTLNSFKGSSLWPIWAAQKQGFFEKQGLNVKNVYTANSVSQMVGLIKGEFEMVTTALDNVIAYAEGEGSPQAPKDADLVAVLGGNNGALSLISSPEIRSIKDLKGSTGARWEAIQKKQSVAGLLNSPTSQLAVAQGYTDLADVIDVLGGYQATVAAARRDWAKNNADTVAGFIRGYRQGLDWLHAPANKAAAIAILQAEISGVTPAAAEENYALLIVDPKGFDPGGKIDAAGAKEVLDLRRRYGPQGKPIADAGHFIDESYFERAAKP